MSKRRGVYQRRPMPAPSTHADMSGSVPQQTVAKPKNRKIPRKFNTAAPSARPVGGGMGNM